MEAQDVGGLKTISAIFQRCAVRVIYSKNTNAALWRAHGRYLVRESVTFDGGSRGIVVDGKNEQAEIVQRLEDWQWAGAALRLPPPDCSTAPGNQVNRDLGEHFRSKLVGADIECLSARPGPGTWRNYIRLQHSEQQRVGKFSLVRNVPLVPDWFPQSMPPYRLIFQPARGLHLPKTNTIRLRTSDLKLPRPTDQRQCTNFCCPLLSVTGANPASRPEGTRQRATVRVPTRSRICRNSGFSFSACLEDQQLPFHQWFPSFDPRLQHQKSSRLPFYFAHAASRIPAVLQ
jgi:hypothetical protein